MAKKPTSRLVCRWRRCTSSPSRSRRASCSAPRPERHRGVSAMERSRSMRRQTYEAPGITVTFDLNVCVHAAVCLRQYPRCSTCDAGGGSTPLRRRPTTLPRRYRTVHPVHCSPSAQTSAAGADHIASADVVGPPREGPCRTASTRLRAPKVIDKFVKHLRPPGRRHSRQAVDRGAAGALLSAREGGGK